MSSWVRRQVSVGIIFVVTLILLINYYFEIPSLPLVERGITDSTVILASFAIIAGTIAIILFNMKGIVRRTAEWQYKALQMAAIIIFVIFGYVQTPLAGGPVFNWLFQYAEQPLVGIMYGLTGFFIVSACFRAFRARSIDSTLLLISGLIILFLNMPWTIWPGFTTAGRWIIDVESVGAIRGVVIGITIGYIAMTIKTMMGRVRGILD